MSGFLKKGIALAAGPSSLLVMSMVQGGGLEKPGWLTIGVALWMVIWWVTEVAPIAVTSLLPIVLFPAMDILDMSQATAPYGHRFVFLFLGGFVIALALEKWDLHKRIALRIIGWTGSGQRSMILGFMLASAFLSMWISNTATTLMMLPIASSVIFILEKNTSLNEKELKRLGMVCMLSIAYAANIGGIATLVGTPPNAAMAGILSEQQGVEITFAEWFKFGLPFSVIMLILSYFLLVRVIHPISNQVSEEGKQVIELEAKKLGAWSSGQFRVMMIFVLTALLWISRSFINDILPFKIDDTMVSIGMAALLFILPSGGQEKAQNSVQWKPLLNWDDTQKLPWGILLLFGGGMSLASAFKATQVVEWLGHLFAGVGDWPILIFILMLCAVALFATELMSNLALVNVFIPVVGSIAVFNDQNPLLLAVPVTMACSCAFMFPMATPPNAIVFSSGRISMSDMARTGVWLNLAGVLILMICLWCYMQLGWL